MIIITDTTEYTEKVLEQKFKWQQDAAIILPAAIKELSNRLFKEGKIFSSKTDSSALWKYMFVVKHASESQFTILMEILKDNNIADGILCLAESGTNFKGYRNRKWETISGNLHLSLYLNPNAAIENFNLGFTILTTISVVQALNLIPDLKDKSAIKWVNDIYINDCKISGVLTQTQTIGNTVSGVFLGVGINVESIPQIAADLIVPKVACLWDFSADRMTCRQSIVLKNLLEMIEINYHKLLKNHYEDLLNIYSKNSLVINKQVKVYSDPFEGDPEFVTEGRVVSIGKNLELYLENKVPPITKGRIVLK